VDGEGQTVPDEIDLGSLAAAYDLGGGLSGSGIAGRGWAWRHQRRGASDEHVAGAVLVPITSTGMNADWRLWSRRSVITITWGEDARPTGYSLSQTAPVEWVPDGATLWAVSGDSEMCLDMSMRRPVACTYRASATAYWCAWYADDGSVVDCEIETSGPASSGDSGLTVQDWAASGAAICPGGTYTHAYQGWQSALIERLRVGPAATQPRIGGTWRDDSTTWTISPVVWTDIVYGIGWGVYGSAACGLVYARQQDVAPPDNNIQAYRRGDSQRLVSGWYTQVTVAGGYRCAILSADPEAAWLAERSDVSVIQDTHYSQDYGKLQYGLSIRAHPSLSPMGDAIYQAGIPAAGSPISLPAPPSPLPDMYPARVRYIGRDGVDVPLAQAHADALLAAISPLGLSLPCTQASIPVSAQSAGGRVLATGVDDGGLSAAGAVTAGRWVGGV
jgi:hypothetical protein